MSDMPDIAATPDVPKASVLDADYAGGSHSVAAAPPNAQEAIARLKAGNEAFLEADVNDGDISSDLVKQLFEHGQAPFACVVTCADSRVVPEHIFMTGLGELFCIRVAGNVIGDMELASCVYAAEHLHTPLILMLGHTHCGAIESAIEARAAGLSAGATDDSGADAEADADANANANALAPLVSRITAAIGDELDPYEASVLNLRAGMDILLADKDIAHLVASGELAVCGAVYCTDSGQVDFLE